MGGYRDHIPRVLGREIRRKILNDLMKRFKLKGWHCQLLVVLVLVVLVLPPVYRGYTKRNSSNFVNREEVVGVWVQNGKDLDSRPIAKSPTGEKLSYIAFDSDGKFYLQVKDPSGLDLEKSSGNWYYSNSRWYLLSFLPWGYQNWIRLNFDHEAGPQFYLTKKDGTVSMHRGDYRASISDTEFKKVEGVDMEKIKTSFDTEVQR